MGNRLRLRAWTMAAPLVFFACTAVVDGEIGAGLGTRCTRNEDCQGTSCIQGLCSVECGADAECPGGTVCASSFCQLPLFAGFIYPGVANEDALSASFEDGRAQAQAELAYLASGTSEEHALASQAFSAAEALVGDGFSVVVGTLPDHGPALVTFAESFPDVTVLAFGARAVRPNLVAFDARAYQAYYLAGIAAARKTVTRRLGIIGSAYAPRIAAQINAFLLGARSVALEPADPPILVEIRWIGGYHDTNPPDGEGKTRERIYTEELLEGGCDVIAHTLDNNIPVSTVGQVGGPDTFAVGANVDTACELAPGKCVGSAFYQWGPLFGRLFEDIHRQQLAGGYVLEGIGVSDAQTVIGFKVPSNLAGAQAIAEEIDDMRSQLAADVGVGRVFDGPIASAQCTALLGLDPCVADGERLSDQGLFDMCWLVDGIVTDAANTPAEMPQEGDCTPPEM